MVQEISPSDANVGEPDTVKAVRPVRRGVVGNTGDAVRWLSTLRAPVERAAGQSGLL